MTRTGGLRHRRRLLAASAVTAVVVGHLLDALGLLPGVDESAAVRAAALAPSYDAMTLAGAAAVACVAEALLRRRRPWLAVAALLAGQTFLLWLPEELARGAAAGEASGEGEEWGALAVAVGLQVLLAAGAVGVALLIDVLLLRLPHLRPGQRLGATQVPVMPVAPLRAGRVAGGVRGRGPPVPVLP